jgi:alpha-beta hydrolase superfamily lysophospholipase
MSMNTSPAILAISVGVLAVFAAGCTANRPFRTDFTPRDSTQSGAASSNAVIESTADYQLGFVEFDDQGWFWDVRQAIAVEQMIRTEAGIGLSNNSRGIVLVVFAHGWKNNAASGNSNVVMFRSTLQQLAAAERVQTNHAARQVVGVYAAWRGLSATLEPFKEMSFWERKNTAHKVGGYGAMTELLVELEALQKAGNDSLPAAAPPTELIIVGHSFGAAAVYSAISEIVTERFVDTVQNGKPLKPLGDQVILLNPAFEATRHFDLNQMAVSISNYPASQRPALSIFTSKGDWATHYAFPIGRFFSTLFEKNRDAEQRSANRDAVGWFQPFVTHDLIYNTNAVVIAGDSYLHIVAPGLSYNTNGKAPPGPNSTFNSTTKRHELRSTDQWRASLDNLRAQRGLWQRKNATADTYTFDDCYLKPRANYQPGDPIPIISVDKKIMKDHDDIANPVIIIFLAEYIEFCRSNSREQPR